MTTPERLRRRQRFESLGIAVLCLMLVGSTLYSAREDQQQNKCLTDQVTKLTDSLTFRTGLTQQDAALNQSADRIQDEVILRVAEATTEAQADAAFDTFRESRAMIETERQNIQEEREANPVPPFPTGACD